MLRQIIVTLCWLPLSLLAQTGPAAPASAADAAAAPALADHGRQGGALFKIQRSSHSAYVFGTIHVGRADFYPFDDKVLQALQQSSSIALEIDPGNTQGLAALMTKYGVYADGKSLAQELPSPLQQQLNPLLEKYGLTPAAVTNMKPWLLATVLGIGEYTHQGYLPQYGVDTTLAAFAKSHGKPLIELETAEQQVSLLGKLTSAEQIQFLQDSIDEIQDPAKAQRSLQMIALWRNGDVDGMAAMLAELTSDDTFTGKFVQRALLDQRNPGLADGIARLTRSTPHAFVGIGMLHLVGKNSVLAILRQRGYTVTRIY
ncbi:TraB/GumN family protein [Collimonas silvisoli]|uniref:TraB/GumN family protein n=1 Tax=Collimonas silvisoli TaxID=2825884 RepID=UPI001B8CDBB3|nr:TraB/GumN family protein [Collimonas silvisoli]